METIVKRMNWKMMLLLPVFLISMSLSAQEKNDYEAAKKEIVETFGVMPVMFQDFPKHALAGAWENFKQLQSPENKIPPKYRELIQLAVSAQIPCQYCVYFHNAAARAFGATDEEVQEAIAHGATTRHWSMILQGNEVDFEQFKLEFDAMMKFMAEKAENAEKADK